ncbi:MAG: MotA/TolQ/ExbB proton channel family protein [Myxococcaceae bacterium]|nr:MotA/TolQ/ExbB proton channel family protein [Myxococcaceae bacterium]
MSFDELVHYIRLGGLTMAVILLASVLALGVGIERLLALWGVGSKARELGQTIARHLLRGDVPAARSAADRATTMSADLFRAGFERAQKTTGPPLDAAVDRERQQLALKMKRGLWILGTIGATTPFVGLFGTVAGIMKSFRDLGLDVEQGGTGGSAAVMTGISEALIATAAGIVVAVEAVVLFNIFQARLSRLNVELKLIAEEFVELLREAPKQGTPSPESSSPAASGPVSTAPAPAGGS